MTLRQLLYFLRLAETLNFRQAADACFVSQSTISTQIKNLEAYLGTCLFNRSLKRVALTASGKQLLPQARSMLNLSELIKQNARQGADPKVARISLGIIPTLAPYYLPHALVVLCKVYPKMIFSLREEMTDTLLEGLDKGVFDAVFLALPTEETHLVERPLFTEKFYATLSTKHRLAKQKTVKATDLRQEKLLLLDEGHCLRAQVLEFCGSSYRQLSAVRATSLETIRHMVAMNIGVSVFPELALGINPPVQVGRIKNLPFLQGNPHRTIGIVWREGAMHKKSLELIADTLKKNSPKSTFTRRTLTISKVRGSR